MLRLPDASGEENAYASRLRTADTTRGGRRGAKSMRKRMPIWAGEVHDEVPTTVPGSAAPLAAPAANEATGFDVRVGVDILEDVLESALMALGSDRASKTEKPWLRT